MAGESGTYPRIDESIRPLQTLSWKEKIADEKKWFKQNINYYIHRSNFNYGQQLNGRKDIKLLYEVYNNQFPAKWFEHITDPLSAKKAAHKAFPAKVRPVGILRTNIDLLLGEYPRRPFIYNVENLGEDGYNSFMEAMMKQVRSNIDLMFRQSVLQEAKANGQQLTPEQEQELTQKVQLPDEIKEDFKKTYKDAKAVKGQKWLKRILREKDIKKRMHRMFKDWLIAGQCYSYKGVFNDDLVYKKISPLNIDYDKSSDSDFIEDGEWVTCRYMMTLADVVDQFYDVLEKPEMDQLEKQYWYQTPMGFYDHLQGVFTDPNERNKVPVYHVCWKGRKKVKFISYMDEETWQIVEKEVDEDYPVIPGVETVTEKWVNEVYEGWRIGPDIYAYLQAVPVQRNEMNNHSACKLPYNGRRYSDTHSDNISILEMGIPFQIMYIIITYILEKTIAKSKGKIVLLDKNTVPNTGGWDEEKFFYYSEALGYALINRNQVGVDKSMNQYQVLDMSLFDQIKQLIELQDYYKQQWDDMTGINRQRKGETYSSDGQGVNERAVFQSTVITDMIFIGFEEFVERELQALLDYGKFLTGKGLKWVMGTSDFDRELEEIMPEDLATAELGVFVDGSSEHMRKLQQAQGLVQAMMQNNVKASTALQIINADNMSELIAKVKQIEEIEMEIAQQTAQSEQEHEQMIEEIQKRHQEYQSLLDIQKINAEFDRKEDIEHIKGEYQVEVASVSAGGQGQDVVPDVNAAVDVELKKKDHEEKRKENQSKRDERNKRLEMDKKQMQHDIAMDKKEHSLKQGQLSLAHKQLNHTIKNDATKNSIARKKKASPNK